MRTNRKLIDGSRTSEYSEIQKFFTICERNNMALREHRASRDGRCVRNWEVCNRFLEGAARVIRNRVEMFLDENALYKKGSGCIFCEGSSPKNAPRIIVEFSKDGGLFTIEDNRRILTFMYKLTHWRGNLMFESNMGLFRHQFEIKIKSYRPFMDKQLEVDLFAPEPLGGGASPPDPNLYYLRPKYPWEIPWFPPKLDPQWWFYLGTFLKCGNNTYKRPDIYIPKVIFSDLDPGEEDDIPFEWPSSRERVWRQIELPLTDEVEVRYKPHSGVIRSFWRFIKRLVAKHLFRRR